MLAFLKNIFVKNAIHKILIKQDRAFKYIKKSLWYSSFIARYLKKLTVNIKIIKENKTQLIYFALLSSIFISLKSLFLGENIKLEMHNNTYIIKI